MFLKIKNKFYALYLKIISSIAFFPVIIATGLFIAAVSLLNFENAEVTKFLIDNFPYLVINNAETARTILGTLIGGIISLTVFSFSMVMILLNQASSSFSPRLLPGLISDKRNQIVLGTFLGVIVYNIIVLISILPTGDAYTMKGFSVLVGIALGIGCLAMFVYFIHSISSSIQINNILDRIFHRTKDRLTKLHELSKERDSFERIEINESQINSTLSGYFQGVNINGLLDFCDEHELNIKIIPYKGAYVLLNSPLYKLSKSLDKELSEELRSFAIFSNQHDLGDNYVLGIKQMTEVGVKAMSPGINDPGTAIITLDYLTELFSQRMTLKDIELYHSPNGFVVDHATLNFKDLIQSSFIAYRQYCKADVILLQKMILMIKYLMNRDAADPGYKDTLEAELIAVSLDIEYSIKNENDKNLLFDLIK